jgi:hypothetical protein
LPHSRVRGRGPGERHIALPVRRILNRSSVQDTPIGELTGAQGIQLDLDTLKDEEGDEVLKDENGKPLYGSNLIDIMPPKIPWTKEQIELVFHINSDSPTWERESFSVW